MVANDELRAHSDLPLMKIICPSAFWHQERSKDAGNSKGCGCEEPRKPRAPSRF